MARSFLVDLTSHKLYSLLVTDERYFDGLPANKPLCSRYDGGYSTPSYEDPNSLNDRISFADYIGAEVYRDNYVFIQSEPNAQEGNYNSGFPYHGGVSYGANLGTVGDFELFDQRKF